MLVRGASATPETVPTPNVYQPLGNNNRKRKQIPAEEEEGKADNGTEADLNVVLTQSSTRPRLTVSRHPIFAPSQDGSPFHTIEVSALNRQLDKIGFKYTPAGVSDPGAIIPFRTIESKPQCTRVSWEDRCHLIKVTQDGLGLCGEKGFASARTNVGVQQGRWYMEVRVEKGGGERLSHISSRMDGAHVRLGWGRREAPLNGPIGLDGYGYGIRDKTGDKVTLSRPKPYGKPFGSGDIIGLYISLPPRRKPNPKDPDDPAQFHRERIAIELKGQEYFESMDYSQSKEMIALMDHQSKIIKSETPQIKKSATVKNLPNERARAQPIVPKPAPVRSLPLPVLAGSKIAFFINGECQGLAYEDIYDFLQLKPESGSRKAKERNRKSKEGQREHSENHFDDGTLGYYPIFSLYGGAQIFMNPGPNFEYPPPNDVDALLTSTPSTADRPTWKPMSERYKEFMEFQWELDRKEEAEAKLAAASPEVLYAIEEKKRVQREKKRLAEAARRKRKTEEKKALAATAPVRAQTNELLDAPGGLTRPAVSVSPAPSMFDQPTYLDMEIEEALLATATFNGTGMSTPNPLKEEMYDMDTSRISMPGTPQYSDEGGPPDDSQSEAQSDYGKDDTMDTSNRIVEQQIDHLLADVAPPPQHISFSG